MRVSDPLVLTNLADDIEMELSKLAKLEQSIQKLQQNIAEAPAYKKSFYESLALNFHNFYTGCERIFSLISVDLNGGIPTDSAWHRRLLQRMTAAQNERQAVISSTTAQALDEFLRFRHVVRNVYGFELEIERVDRLLAKYPAAWAQFEGDLREFVDWLKGIAIALKDQ